MRISTHRSRLAFPVASCASGTRLSQTSNPNHPPGYNVQASHSPSHRCKSLKLQESKKYFPHLLKICASTLQLSLIAAANAATSA